MRGIGNHTVEKIGGTSMSATDTMIENVIVHGRSEAEMYHRIFVVSAYSGMTDLLLEHKKTGEPGVYARFTVDDGEARWGDALTAVAQSMRSKNAELFSEGSARASADAFVERRIADMRACLADVDRLRGYGHFRLTEPLETVREMLASLGEAHSAYTTTLLLQARGINARFLDLTGWQEAEARPLDDKIRSAFEDVDVATELPIATGYARCKGGMFGQYQRGYSEMTFSRIAVLTGAREAVIHKEFHLSSADPKLVGPDRARKINRTNYDVADQLANLGMEAIHPRASRGLRQRKIPLRVRNTFDPADEGTGICGDYVSETPQVEIITGLRTVHALQFFEQDMVGEKGYDHGLLDVLAKRRAWIVSKSSNANTITHYLDTSPTTLRKVIGDLEERFQTAAITSHAVAMVAIIGSDISTPGLVSAAMAALSERGIAVMGLQHQIRNVDVQFIIAREDFDAAIDALHTALIETREPSSITRRAA